MKPLTQINILINKDEFYDHQYPWALDFIDDAESTHWKFNETNIDSDIHDLKTKLTPQELHGISETLRLFTLYETKVGNDYWLDIIRKVFGHPEIKMMATRFAYDEVVHSRAYSEINRCLGYDTEEFMTGYQQDRQLSERMRFISAAANLPRIYTALDLLRSIAAFILVEGVILFSNFAYIKHFKSGGKNLLTGITSAIDYSVRDERRHCEGGLMLFNTLFKESELTDREQEYLANHIVIVSETIIKHEALIINKIFDRGDIIGIEPDDMNRFINNRVVYLLGKFNLKLDKFNRKVESCEIQDWFYSNINGLKLSDFFVKTSTAYSRHWNKGLF